jgi:hypothetical protein
VSNLRVIDVSSADTKIGIAGGSGTEAALIYE